MTTQDLTNHVEAVRAAATRAQDAPTDTTVAVALTTALNSPKNFNGRKVIAREAATYTHPSPVVKGPVTSKIIDKVLLEDDAEVYQCRTCGSPWPSAQSAMAHTGAHSRTADERSNAARAGAAAAAEARTRKAKETMTQAQSPTTNLDGTYTATPSAVAAKVAAKNATPSGAQARDAIDAVVHNATTRVSGVIHPDVHEIVRNARALAHQLVRMSEALAAMAAAVITLGAKLNEKPEITPEEIADLRSKADQLDMLKNLLNK
jgi:hypothetical protein